MRGTKKLALPDARDNLAGYKVGAHGGNDADHGSSTVELLGFFVEHRLHKCRIVGQALRRAQ